MTDYTFQSEATLTRFNRLMTELLRSSIHRNTFNRWEIDILLDIQACAMSDSSKRLYLRRYQKAVQRRLLRGQVAPLLFSEYLEILRQRREGRKRTLEAA
jgi:hypothetical protein